MADLQDVIRDAMRLSSANRAELAERLLESLEQLDEAEAERLWAEEAERRLAALRAARARTHPAETVHEEARRLLK